MSNSANNLYVVVGLGITGLSCVRHLCQKNYQVAVVDTRTNPPGLTELKQHYPNVHYQVGKLDPVLLMQAKEIIISPGLSLKTPEIKQAISQGIPVIGDIELFVRETSKPIIAITGTNGKSTVVSLVGDMIKASGFKTVVCGNIGEPVLNCLEQEVDYYVLELSSFQLETTHSLAAQAAVILNLSADHLDRYESLAQYLQAKQSIYLNCEHAIINLDEPKLWRELDFKNAPLSFSLESTKADFALTQQDNTDYLAHKNQPLIAVNALPYPEKHNLQNA